MFIIALEHQWPALCKAIGRPELVTDPRYDTNAKRTQRIPEVVQIIETWLASTSSDEEALRILEEARGCPWPQCSQSQKRSTTRIFGSGAPCVG